MPPATAPLTGTTASRSSGGSGESDSSPGNISGQDSASAAPPDDGESSMVPRRDKAAAAGRRAAPRPACGKGRRRAQRRGRDPRGRRRGRGSAPSPPPTAGRSGAAAHLLPAGGTQAGRWLQGAPAEGGSGLRCGSLPGEGERTRKHPEERLASRSPQSRWGCRGAGGAGLGASPPGAAPSDRLPPPPPQELRVSAPSA